VKAGPVTILKVSGDLSRWFVEEGMLLECQAKPDLCRTQLLVRLTDASRASYFLSNPIGNHHIVVLGHHKRLLEEFLALTVCR
jgi:L-fucose isomerase-like protein